MVRGLLLACLLFTLAQCKRPVSSSYTPILTRFENSVRSGNKDKYLAQLSPEAPQLYWSDSRGQKHQLDLTLALPGLTAMYEKLDPYCIFSSEPESEVKRYPEGSASPTDIYYRRATTITTSDDLPIVKITILKMRHMLKRGWLELNYQPYQDVYRIEAIEVLVPYDFKP